jgi:hypothetical protein
MEGEMDAQILVQATILVRAGIDAAKALIAWLPRRKSARDLIPVYRLVTREQLVAARAGRAINITGQRWPVSADM